MSAKPVVVLDPGHGGADSGALGPKGTRECDINLSVCMLAGVELMASGKVTVKYTRKDDSYLSLGQRAAIANRAGAHAVLSVHCNAADGPGGKGFEIFTTVGQTEGDRLATCVHRAVRRAMPGLPAREDWRDGDPDKEANFAIVRLTRAPAALLELEFIHTEEGETWLLQKTHLVTYAGAISRGILSFLGK